MSETELSVVCKNCGSEVSPYVTECPYCGTRLRKRAPKLERRGDAFEAQKPRRRRPHFPRRRRKPGAEALRVERPYATAGAILVSAVLLLVQKASGDPLATFGGLIVPLEGDWWRLLTAPFAYVDVGYLFVVAVGLAIFATGVERRLGSLPTAVALGAVAAWFAIRRSESQGSIDQEYDLIGVIVAAVVLIALPVFVPTADFVAGLVGGAVGGLAGLASSALHSRS